MANSAFLESLITAGFHSIGCEFDIHRLRLHNCDNEQNIRDEIDNKDVVALLSAILPYCNDIKHANTTGYIFVDAVLRTLRIIEGEFKRLNEPFPIIPKLTDLSLQKCQYADKFRSNAITNEQFNLMNEDEINKII